MSITGWSSASKEPRHLCAELGKTIRTNPRPIAMHCLSELRPVSEDIATIVESLALADRIQTRHRATRWTRRLEVEIPVFELAKFQTSAIGHALVDAVCFLTGDDWQIRFVQRTGLPMNEPYLSLAPDPPRFVIPFSNGLDSFAQSRLLESEHGSSAVLKVRAGHLQGGSRQRPSEMLEVKRGFLANHPREKTYRTRPLVYFSIAAIAAVTVKAESIVIGENGQGALGPSFARFHNEWPFRSAHPGFIARLSTFLSAAFEADVVFKQPQLWRTKGEVLRELHDRDLLAGWQETQSCSMRPLQRQGRHACGICGGCLLRQTAGWAAKIEPGSIATYSLEAFIPKSVSNKAAEAEIGRNEQEILTRAAMSMAAFADLPLRPDSSRVIAREARDIPGQFPEVVEMLTSLIDRHAQEWRGFLQSLPSDAWLNRYFSKP